MRSALCRNGQTIDLKKRLNDESTIEEDLSELLLPELARGWKENKISWGRLNGFKGGARQLRQVSFLKIWGASRIIGALSLPQVHHTEKSRSELETCQSWRCIEKSNIKATFWVNYEDILRTSDSHKEHEGFWHKS